MEIKEFQTRFSGKALVLGKNIDTDQIFPGRFLDITDPAEMAKLCLSGLDPAIAGNFPDRGIIVAGTNFGCGSSRESAVIALMAMGAGIIAAESFARIFFRNAINLGLPLITCPGISEKISPEDEINIDILAGEIVVKGSGEILSCPALSENALSILSAGGIKALMRQRPGRE